MLGTIISFCILVDGKFIRKKNTIKDLYLNILIWLQNYATKYKIESNRIAPRSL